MVDRSTEPGPAPLHRLEGRARRCLLFLNPRIRISSLETTEREDLPSFIPTHSLGKVRPDYAVFTFALVSVTFPSGLPVWLSMLGGVPRFTISCYFCAERLFSVLRLVSQLEVLRVAPTRRYLFLPHSNEISAPVALNHLSLLAIEDTILDFLITLLEYLSLPADVRMHLKVSGSHSTSLIPTYLWDRFSSLMHDTIADFPIPVHGIHFGRGPSRTCIRLTNRACGGGRRRPATTSCRYRSYNWWRLRAQMYVHRLKEVLNVIFHIDHNACFYSSMGQYGHWWLCMRSESSQAGTRARSQRVSPASLEL